MTTFMISLTTALAVAGFAYFALCMTLSNLALMQARMIEAEDNRRLSHAHDQRPA